MTVNDPWTILGLVPGSSLADARAARRRLAKQLHPDLHAGMAVGESAALAARMTEVNQALAAIELGGAGTAAAARPSTAAPGSTHPTSPSRADPPTRADRATLDDSTPPTLDDTFSVDWLPAEAFEALFLAAYALGDILVTDEPYLLELHLLEPAPCFCRVTLVPEAGGSIVTVDVSPARDGGTAPETAAVVDLLIAELNALVIG